MKNSDSTRSNYWSTMRALSSEENKRYGPFSTNGSNGNNNDNDDLQSEHEENHNLNQHDNRNENDNDQWAGAALKQEKSSQGSSAISTSVPPNDIDRINDHADDLEHHDDQYPSEDKSISELDQDEGEEMQHDALPLFKREKVSENVFGDSHVSDDDCGDDNLDEVNLGDNQNEDDGDNVMVYDEGDNNVSIPSSNGDKVTKSELVDDDDDDDEAGFKTSDQNIWTLPQSRDECTLEEIRRGQVINSIAPNECPVIGCGKKINDTKLDPSPGTIASGLRTHVLFVHYANRKSTKKRKLCWSTKRRSQPSPKKPLSAISSATSSRRDFEADILSSTATSLMPNNKNPKNYNSKAHTPGSLLNKKVNEMAAKSHANQQMSSLQSLMQATYGTNMVSPNRQNQPPQQLQPAKNTDFDPLQKNSFNPTTSSLFSILAGLTQQQQNTNPPARKANQSNNTINPSQCSRNSSMNANNSNRSSVSSSLLSLLNENVTSSLQSQLKKSLVPDSRSKSSIPTSRHSNSLLNNSTNYQLNSNNDVIFNNHNNSSSILNGLCSGSGEIRSSYDNSMPLNSFVESLAIKTGANIGPAGIAEAKKIIEKFTKSLLCSSQTIADHYLAPYVGESPQQKPEISPSDIMLAYKMMHKSHGQP